MILSEWRLNIHFFSVHCNLLNVDTPKEQFSGPFLTSLKKKYPLIHLLCLLYIYITHSWRGGRSNSGMPPRRSLCFSRPFFFFYHQDLSVKLFKQ